jgi:hypothetical protein
MIDKDRMGDVRIIFLEDYDNPEFSQGRLGQKVRHLKDDLNYLSDGQNIKELYFDNEITVVDDQRRFISGIRFEVSLNNLEPVLIRLQERLCFEPIRTRISVSISEINVQVETDDPNDLNGIIKIFRQNYIFHPSFDYLLMAEKYVRRENEISAVAEDNLDLLREQIVLSTNIDFPIRDSYYLRAKAAGPFKTLNERLRYFEEVVNDEVKHFEKLFKMGYFRISKPEEFDDIEKDIELSFQELAENLSLERNEAQRYYKDKIRQTQSKLKKIDAENKSSAKLNERLAMEKRDHEKALQKEQERKERLNSYRILFQKSLQDNLFPSEIEQAKLLQIRRLLEKTDAEIIQIEEQIRSEIHGPNISEFGANYSRLRYLLYQNQWEAADKETEYVLLSVFSQEMIPFNEISIQQIPAIDIQTIDKLWSHYSKGKFGFEAQFSVYASMQNLRQSQRSYPVSSFQYDIGWRDEPSWFRRGVKSYRELDFSTDAPKGHLPTWRWCCQSLSNEYLIQDSLVLSVLSHFERCLNSFLPRVVPVNTNSLEGNEEVSNIANDE